VQPLGRVAGGVGRDQQEGAFPLGEGERSGGEEIARERRGGAVDGDGLDRKTGPVRSMVK